MPAAFTLVRSARRRRTIALRVMPDGTLTVRAPVRTNLRWIERFIESRADWIAKRRAAKRMEETPLRNGSHLAIGGENFELSVERGSYEPARAENGILRLCLDPDLSEPALEAEIRTELSLFGKKRARAHFESRAAFWADKMGLKPARIALSAPRRQWGSCNGRNEIRLNWRLIFAGTALLDYVIVHELAHIAHKNHGPAFWRCVAAALPDWKERRKILRTWAAPFG